MVIVIVRERVLVRAMVRVVLAYYSVTTYYYSVTNYYYQETVPNHSKMLEDIGQDRYRLAEKQPTIASIGSKDIHVVQAVIVTALYHGNSNSTGRRIARNY